MLIVPSGTRRIVAQQAAPATQPPKREGIQQEEIAPEAKEVGGGDFNPMAKLDNTLQNQSKQPAAKPAVPDKMQLNQAVQPKQDPREAIAKNIENISAFKEQFAHFVQRFNINMQLITRDKNKRKMLDRMFEIAPTTGKGRIEIPGWWIGPDGERHVIKYTDAYKELKQLANQHEFDVVPTKMGMGEDIYGFDITPLSASVEDTQALNGLEQAYGNTGGGAGENEQRKAAESRHSLIKESHNEILASLIKSGFGGTK